MHRDKTSSKAPRLQPWPQRDRFMSACATLLELYQEWRKWTETEGEAILANDWRQVVRCQAAKTELQPRILKQTDLAEAECARDGIDRNAFKKKVRSRVNEL